MLVQISDLHIEAIAKHAAFLSTPPRHDVRRDEAVMRSGDDRTVRLDPDDSGWRLRRVVAAINTLAPTPVAVVATGDLVNEGTSAEYARLREIIADLVPPLYLMPGNHDNRAALRAAFPEHRYLPTSGPLHYQVDLGTFVLVALDTTVVGEPGGVIDDGTLAFLETVEATRQKPCIIALHHPPVASGIQPMDAMGLCGADRLAARLSTMPNVLRVLAGHLHRPLIAPFGGSILTVCPSPAFSVQLDLVQPSGLAIDYDAPMFHIHGIVDGRLVTHTQILPAEERGR